LIVDDSPPFRATAAKLFAIRGMEPFDVVAAARKRSPRSKVLARMGCCSTSILPGRNGFEVAAALAARCPRFDRPDVIRDRRG